MNFRFILQPLMALIFAIVAGLKDGKAGKPPYFWSLLTGRARRVDSITAYRLRYCAPSGSTLISQAMSVSSRLPSCGSY
jgi:hypothetical protein